MRQRRNDYRSPRTAHTPPRCVAVASVVFFLVPLSAIAQVVRLPAVEPSSGVPPGQLVSHPDSSSEILQAPGDLDVAPATRPPDQPQLPPGVRNGFFQRATVDATWLAPTGGKQGLEIDALHTEGIFALPCPTVESPLVIRPGFDVQSLQTQADVDVPQQLYTAYTQFRWMSQVTPQWGLDCAVTPGVYSDFDQSSSNAFRLTGHGAAAWTWTDQAKIVLGAAYLDMPDTNVIPIGGLMWTPNGDWKFDLIFPHPRISRRIDWLDRNDDKVQNWAYIAGEFTNDQWSFRRVDGRNDQVLLRDYRLVLGVERKVFNGVSPRLEVGYVFGRRVRYVSDTPDFYPADTAMVRGGLTY